MKMRIVLPAALLGGFILMVSLAQRQTPRVAAADGASLFLIRFGLDGAPDVDWSGSLSAEGASLAGWQFDGKDTLQGNAWTCATRKETYWDTPYERRLQPTTRTERVTGKGILVRLENARSRRVQVATKQGAFAFDTDLAPGDPARLFLDGKASVAWAPATSLAASGPEAEDFPSLLQARDGVLWMAYASYVAGKGDRVFAARRTGGVWSAPEALTEPGGDVFRTAIAQDGSGKVWVVWAARVNADFDLQGRFHDDKRWSAPQQLTAAKNGDIWHVLAADAGGRLCLAYQSARSGNFDIYMRVYDGRNWSQEIQVSTDPANDWEPALAVAPDGGVAVLWDSYAAGNYDVLARTYAGGKLGPVIPIAVTGAMEGRVSAAYDRRGRLWIAWDEGDWNWGKDYGHDIPESGRGLLVRRQTRVAVFAKGRLFETAAPFIDAIPEHSRQVFHHPAIVLDANGNPWIFLRTRNNLPFQRARGSLHDYEQPFRAYWRVAATTWKDGRWAPLIEFQEGFGRMDSPLTAAVQNNGTLALAWASEERHWPYGRPGGREIRFAAIPSAPQQAEIPLVAFAIPAERLPASHAKEASDIQRVRRYRGEIGGRTLRVVRGDLHRHTDVSWDGNRDGSLDDSYRYALDAAGFDFMGVCDHQGGQSPYDWWRIQKAVDLYTIEGRFAPLYSYERSLKWPNGHRNVFFARRGRPIFEMSDQEIAGLEGAAKLYAYLRQFAGVAISHTSASGGGTDWRDSDAELEPVVEVYQGYRNSSEAPDGPRAWPEKEGKRFGAGFVSNAWSKGIRMGVQSSSDHVSTHISYAGLYVDSLTRDALIAALKARRSYAATDNLLVETRMGAHFMGDVFRTDVVPPLAVYVSGTAPVAKVEVIRNNKVVYVHGGGEPEVRFTYTDNDPQRGESLYYVRAQQTDGQLCWSSPIWVQLRQGMWNDK